MFEGGARRVGGGQTWGSKGTTFSSGLPDIRFRSIRRTAARGLHLLDPPRHAVPTEGRPMRPAERAADAARERAADAARERAGTRERAQAAHRRCSPCAELDGPRALAPAAIPCTPRVGPAEAHPGAILASAGWRLVAPERGARTPPPHAELEPEGEIMKTLRVRDIMTTDVYAVHAGASVEESARALNSRRISGAPVVDGSRIVGVISMTDLAQPWSRLADGSAPVDAIMTRLIYAVRPGDPVMTAVRLMVEEDIHRAVVVTHEGRLAGMITAMDVLRALARGNGVQEGDYALEEHLEVHSEPGVAVGYVDLRTFELAS
jgi:CBS domain-containing protein